MGSSSRWWLNRMLTRHPARPNFDHLIEPTESVYQTPHRSWPDAPVPVASDKPRWTEPPPRWWRAAGLTGCMTGMYPVLCRLLGNVRFNSHREIHWCRTHPHVCLPGCAKSWPEAPPRGLTAGFSVAELDGQISTSFVPEGEGFLANPSPTRLTMLAVTTSQAVANPPMPRHQHCGQTQAPRQRFSSEDHSGRSRCRPRCRPCACWFRRGRRTRIRPLCVSPRIAPAEAQTRTLAFVL